VLHCPWFAGKKPLILHLGQGRIKGSGADPVTVSGQFVCQPDAENFLLFRMIKARQLDVLRKIKK
jgi:hypothetical protein